MGTLEIVLIGIGCFVLGAILVGLLTYFLVVNRQNKAQGSAKRIIAEADEKAAGIVNKSREDAENNLKVSREQANLELKSAKADGDAYLAKAKAQAEVYRAQIKEEAEKQIADRRGELDAYERKLDAREDTLDKRDTALTSKEAELGLKEKGLADQGEALAKREASLKVSEAQVDQELAKVANLTMDEAKKAIMAKAEERSAAEVAQYLEDRREEAESAAEDKARDILALACERYSQDVAVEKTTTTVSLPNDEMKGRVIGREGRNIKTLEALMGVDILIDDTPEVLTVSCFDPVRREVAVKSLEALIKDGRIQPGRIEEVYEKTKATIDDDIRKTGDETVMRLGLPRINKELCKYIGRLKYRTSFGQNVLDHSIQVATLCGMMAAELGIDQTMAKRCGLLHDIGKAADSEMEGSHVEIGVRLAKKYGEPDQVISAIASHHGDVEKRYVTDELVVAADTLSAARPGARSETLENYIKRLEDIENICKSYDGVKNCYALQSGRDVRVMVLPEKVDDSGIVLLGQKIRDRIQSEMTYPGNIKITVIRETRHVEIAK